MCEEEEDEISRLGMCRSADSGRKRSLRFSRAAKILLVVGVVGVVVFPCGLPLPVVEGGLLGDGSQVLDIAVLPDKQHAQDGNEEQKLP